MAKPNGGAIITLTALDPNGQIKQRNLQIRPEDIRQAKLKEIAKVLLRSDKPPPLDVDDKGVVIKTIFVYGRTDDE